MSDTKLQIAKELTLALLEKDMIGLPPKRPGNSEFNGPVVDGLMRTYETIYSTLCRIEKQD